MKFDVEPPACSTSIFDSLLSRYVLAVEYRSAQALSLSAAESDTWRGWLSAAPACGGPMVSGGISAHAANREATIAVVMRCLACAERRGEDSLVFMYSAQDH